MKHIVLFTILVGLFFGTLRSVAALPPLQYYVRWATPVLYTCTHSSGQYELFVSQTHLDYLAPNTAIMNETDIVDNSNGHFVTPQATESDWMNFSGTRAHTTYTIDSASYPITIQAVLRTYVNGAEVYRSTFTARCTGSSHGGLSATIDNNDNPLIYGVWQPSTFTNTHP